MSESVDTIPDKLPGVNEYVEGIEADLLPRYSNDISPGELMQILRPVVRGELEERLNNRYAPGERQWRHPFQREATTTLELLDKLCPIKGTMVEVWPERFREIIDSRVSDDDRAEFTSIWQEPASWRTWISFAGDPFMDLDQQRRDARAREYKELIDGLAKKNAV